jgi:hypothetical protein
VAEGMGHVIDPAGEASRALLAAVAQHGPSVLGDAARLDDVCRDRLVGLPGEAVLISSAARSDVPALLRQRAADGLGLDVAIASAAATLSQAHSLDDTACLWVVTEFARALGYPVPMRTQPTIVMPQPPTAGTQPPTPTGSGGVTDQGDALAPTAPVPTPAGPTGFGPAGSAGPAGPPLGPPGSGEATEPLATPPGGPQPGRIRVNRGVLAAAAAIALVVTYLGIALAAHLSPFAKTSNPSPAPISPSSTDPGPSGLGLAGSSDHSDWSSPGPAADPDGAPSDSVPGRGPDGTRRNPGPVAVIRYADARDLAAGALPAWLFTTT